MNLKLDEYKIMPNHIHGIIQIGDNEYNKYDDGIIAGCDCRCGDAVHGRDAMHGVSTTTTNNELTQNRENKFGPQRKNLSSIIRGFKSAVTTNARRINPYFAWQSRFYDHIIRDEKSLENIRRYIKNNPENWKGDEFNSDDKKENRTK